MKRLWILMAGVLILASLSGCGKKQEMEELQPITLESLSIPASANMQVAPDMKAGEVNPAALPVTAAAPKEVVPLPPQGPYKPTGIEIQTALKRAGYYTGNIDNKIGPMTKKAIKDFQGANGLQVDGKVGPKTWAVLSKYLNAPAEPVVR